MWPLEITCWSDFSSRDSTCGAFICPSGLATRLHIELGRRIYFILLGELPSPESILEGGEGLQWQMLVVGPGDDV